MHDSKLIRVLKSFSHKEFLEFRKYLASPLHNNNSMLLKLYDTIRRNHPSFKSSKLSMENVYSSLYPGKKFNLNIMRNIMTGMYKAAEGYLAYLGFRGDELYYKKYLLEKLTEKDIDGPFEYTWKTTSSRIDREGIIDDNYFLSKYMLLKSKRNFYENKTALGKRKKFYDEIIVEIDFLLLYFITKILKYYILLINEEKHLEYKFNMKFLDELCSFIKNNKFDDYPIVKMFYYVIIINQKPKDEKTFKELRSLVNKNINSIHKDDQQLLFTQLFNFSKVRYISGDTKYRTVNFMLMKEMLERDIYPMEGPYMTEGTYINIASAGLIEKELEWTGKFIWQYKNRVTPEHRANAHKYCLGILNYRKKQYEDALKLLKKVRSKDFYSVIRVKNHLTKIYMETHDYDKLMDEIEKFNKYLKKHKLIPDYIKTRFTLYVNFLEKITNLKLSPDLYDRSQILQELENTTGLENKSWLLEQI